MQIDWFEIVAQIINFFIILFILQKLLYKPVINMMETRQERIQKDQIEAEEKMNKAEELISEYDTKIAGVEDEKREILDDARDQAQERKQELLEIYKEEAENKRQVYLNEIEDEKELFIKNLRKKLGQNAVKLASHILSNISSKELEDEIFNTFLENIRNLKDNIEEPGLLDEEKDIELYSAEELSQDKKEKIKEVLGEQVENLDHLEFAVDEDLVLGYQLSLETYTVHTDIKNYLDSIEEEIIEEIEKN